MSAATALDALHAARMAWERSQPQYVIPGVLEEVDAALPFVEPHGGVRLLEPTRLDPGAEPHSDRSHRVPGSRPFCLPRLPGDASAPISPAEETGAGTPPTTERADTRIGVSSASAGPNNNDRPSAARHPMSCAAEGQKEAV